MMDTRKIRLRELKEADRELYLLAASEEPGCEELYSDNLIANILWSLAYGDKGERKYFAVENEEGSFIGYCSVEEGETPEIGIDLLPDYQSKGIGVTVIRLLWIRISQERKLRYFIARVEAKNTKSIRMFEKLGAKIMNTEESNLVKYLRELVLKDKSFEASLKKLEEFNSKIRQYRWSIENFTVEEKKYGIK